MSEEQQENNGLSEDNVLQHILDKHVAPQEGDESEDTPQEEAPADTQDEVIEEDYENESQDEDQEPYEAPLYKVTLSGGEVSEVTEEELLKGYSRNDDYSRKTMALADERKAVEATKQEYDQKLQQVIGQVDNFISEKERQLKQAESIDWLKLHKEDPDQAAELKYMLDAAKAEVDEANRVKQTHLEESSKKAEQQRQEYLVAQQNVLLSRMPELKDKEKAKETFSKVNKAFADHGFADAEINNLIDARAIEMAYKAALYDEAQAKKPEVVKKGKKLPKYQKSGAPRTRSADSKARYDSAYTQAKASGGDRSSVQNLILSKLKK